MCVDVYKLHMHVRVQQIIKQAHRYLYAYGYTNRRLTHACMQACIHAYMPTCLRTYIQTHMHARIHTRIDIHIHIHIIHICIKKETQNRGSRWPDTGSWGRCSCALDAEMCR